MLQKSWRRNLGWTLVGDGIAGLIWPRRYLRALARKETNSSERDSRGSVGRPQLTRALCAGEVALGLWIILR
jgi:hypothetical protein